MHCLKTKTKTKQPLGRYTQNSDNCVPKRKNEVESGDKEVFNLYL